MIRKLLTAAGVAAALVAVSACEASKSSTPLSPSVAGPIPGVTISAPKMLEPVSGQLIIADILQLDDNILKLHFTISAGITQVNTEVFTHIK